MSNMGPQARDMVHVTSWLICFYRRWSPWSIILKYLTLLAMYLCLITQGKLEENQFSAIFAIVTSIIFLAMSHVINNMMVHRKTRCYYPTMGKCHTIINMVFDEPLRVVPMVYWWFLFSLNDLPHKKNADLVTWLMKKEGKNYRSWIN
jgi:hypothetical protein